VKPLLGEEQINRFYESWNEPELYRKWGGLWRKQFKLVSGDGRFIALNKRIPRPGFRKLKKAATALAPVHIYASVLEFLMPERVANKERTRRAYPVARALLP
jgi:hypothetical protein